MKTTTSTKHFDSIYDAFWYYSSLPLAALSILSSVLSFLEGTKGHAMFSLLFAFYWLFQNYKSRRTVEKVSVQLLHAENSNVYRCFKDDFEVFILGDTEAEVDLYMELLYSDLEDYEVEIVQRGVITKFDIRATEKNSFNEPREIKKETLAERENRLNDEEG